MIAWAGYFMAFVGVIVFVCWSWSRPWSTSRWPLFLASNGRRQRPSSVRNHALYGMFSATRPP